MRFSLLICVFLACGALAACGSNDGSEATGSGAPAESAENGTADSPVGAAYGSDADDSARRQTVISQVEGAPNPPPFELPAERPGKEVTIRDIREGTGAKIAKGDFFSASYISLNYDEPKGTQLEDHWTTGPFNWYWEDEALTEGWEAGLTGMRVGGLRELLVPSKLAYGDGDRAYLVELLTLKR